MRTTSPPSWQVPARSAEAESRARVQSAMTSPTGSPARRRKASREKGDAVCRQHDLRPARRGLCAANLNLSTG